MEGGLAVVQVTPERNTDGLFKVIKQTIKDDTVGSKRCQNVKKEAKIRRDHTQQHRKAIRT